jgi:hypothetical protein
MRVATMESQQTILGLLHEILKKQESEFKSLKADLASIKQVIGIGVAVSFKATVVVNKQ